MIYLKTGFHFASVVGQFEKDKKNDSMCAGKKKEKKKEWCTGKKH